MDKALLSNMYTCVSSVVGVEFIVTGPLAVFTASLKGLNASCCISNANIVSGMVES